MKEKLFLLLLRFPFFLLSFLPRMTSILPSQTSSSTALFLLPDTANFRNCEESWKGEGGEAISLSYYFSLATPLPLQGCAMVRLTFPTLRKRERKERRIFPALFRPDPLPPKGRDAIQGKFSPTAGALLLPLFSPGDFASDACLHCLFCSPRWHGDFFLLSPFLVFLGLSRRSGGESRAT